MLYASFQKFLDFDKAQWMAVDRQIRKRIPMAKNHRRKPALDFENEFPWSLATLQMQIATTSFNKKFNTGHKGGPYTSKWFFDLCERVRCKPAMAVNSIGSLGGGNHFIEFSNSQKTGNTGVTVHSGSRNLGLKVCNYWQRLAKDNLKKRYEIDFQNTIKDIKANNPMNAWNALIRAAKLPPTPTGLEYLDGEDMYGYLHDMFFCQVYAHSNVNTMMYEIIKILNLDPVLMASKDTVHTVHNYISFEDWIIRKGAVSSYIGQNMLIPLNMEEGIDIYEGKSNEDWYNSAPHGAGRRFGRKEMKLRRDIDTRVIRERMNKKGIYLSIVPKDEVKEAYKPSEFIRKEITPTASFVDHLVPVLTLKADD